MAAAAAAAGAGAGTEASNGTTPAWPHKRIGSATADATVLLPVVEANTNLELMEAIAAARVELAALKAGTQLRRVFHCVENAAVEVLLSGQRMFTWSVDPVLILRIFNANAPSLTTTRSDCALLLGLLQPFGVLDTIMRNAADINSPVFSMKALRLPVLVHAVLDMTDADNQPHTVSLTPIIRAMQYADAVPTAPEAHHLVHRLAGRLSEEEWAAAPDRDCAMLHVTQFHHAWTHVFLRHCAFDGTRFPLSGTPGTAQLLSILRLRNEYTLADLERGCPRERQGLAKCAARQLVLEKDAEIKQWRAGVGAALHTALDLAFHGDELMGLYSLVVTYMLPPPILATVLPRPLSLTTAFAPIAAAPAADTDTASVASVASVVVG